MYEENINADGVSKQIKVQFLIKVAPGFKYEYSCDHMYRPDEGSLSWTLDSSKVNDFESIVGKWIVLPHPTQANCSIVSYSADLAMKGYVPGFITSILEKTALKSAVSWVKKHGEAQWREEGVSMFCSSSVDQQQKAVAPQSSTSKMIYRRNAALVGTTVVGASLIGYRGWVKSGKCKDCKRCVNGSCNRLNRQ